MRKNFPEFFLKEKSRKISIFFWKMKKNISMFLFFSYGVTKNFGSYLLQEKKPFGDISKTFLVINFLYWIKTFGTPCIYMMSQFEK